MVTIRVARDADLVVLVGIERSAGEAFRAIGMPEIADDDPGSPAELRPFLQAGNLLVAVDRFDRAIAYLQLKAVDGDLHIEQVSVRADRARRGIGRVLIDEADATARRRGLAGLTLTTFEHVPGIAPYYERLGFVLFPEPDVIGEIRRIRDEERKRGLDRWPRVVMRRNLV